MLVVGAGLSQHVDQELGQGDGAVDAHRLAVLAIGLGDDGVEALVVEIDALGVRSPDRPTSRPILQVQEAQRALVAGLALNLGDVEHVVQVHDVRIDVRGVDPVGLVDGDVFH